MNSVSKKEKLNAFLMILVFTFCYQLLMANSLTPLGSFEGDDSLVFKQMGLGMLQGKIPYVDLFDHKGPVIYFINAFCQWLIAGRWGLFLGFCLNIALATYVWWLIAKVLVRSWEAIWPVVVGLCSYMVVLSDGNLSEEWSLVPISYALYVFVRHFVEGREISRRAFFLVGVSLGIVTFIRLNNAAAPCCAILVYTICHLHRRIVTPSQLLKSLLTIFLGWAAVLVVSTLVIFCLYGSEGVVAMFYGTFVFNFEYMGAPLAVASDRKLVYIYFGLTTLVILILLLLKRRVTTFSVLIALCYLGSFAAIGSKGWGNYFIIFVPVTVMATAYLYEVTNKLQKSLVLLMLFFVVPRNVYLSSMTLDRDADFFMVADEEFMKIPEAERGQVWNNAHFNGLALLHRHGLTQANSVMINFQMLISERLKLAEKARFDSLRPAWILAPKAFEEEMPLPLDSNRVISSYQLKAVVGDKPWRKLYFYQKIEE